ncbi:MAG: acetyl-CoA decarbonylase/synthase complex subunit gamma [Candidatus Hydrothermarchaeales archaeon]
MVKISPLEIYKLLPGTNCKECGEESCMAFASKLIERAKGVGDCPPLAEDKYLEKREKLIELVTPPVKEVVVGVGERAVAIGGEEVMYRHELTFFNKTAFFIDVHDEMSQEELAKKVEAIDKFTFGRVGQELKLQGVAVRAKSGEPTKFGEAVLVVTEKTDLPLMLCSYDPKLLEVALEIALDRRPLIYAATKDNWEQVVNLALKHACPVVVSSPGDIEGLIELSQNLMENGIEDIVLDIGTYPDGGQLKAMEENLVMLRRSAIEEEVKPLGFPILGVPMVAGMREKDPVKAAMAEVTLGASLILKYCDIMVVSSMEVWSLLPLLTIRQNIYTDPRMPLQVEAGLKILGSPDENAPVFLTSNFALTYYTVASDLEAAKIPCYVLVADTDGHAVEVSMAGQKLTADVVKNVLESSKVAEKVKHKKLIIPGRASRISGEIEDATGWEVMVGPIDSARIPKFLDEKWNGTAVSKGRQ